MILIILPICVLSETRSIPKISFIVTSDSFNDDSKEELEKNYQSYIKNLNDSCKLLSGEEKELLEARINSYQGFYVSNGADINSKLSSVPKNTDILFFLSGDIRSSINFNKLKTQMIVFMISDDELNAKTLSENDEPKTTSQKFKKVMTIMNNWPFDINNQNILQLINNIEIKGKRSPKAKCDINVVGDIKEKVSFLTIVSYYLNVVQGELNCHTVYLHHTDIDSDSKKINTEFFIANDETHRYLFDEYGRLMHYKVITNQYALTIKERGTPLDFTIEYNEDSWNTYTCDEDRRNSCIYVMKIPYSFANVFSLITNVVSFEIKSVDAFLDFYQPINLTIVDELPTVFPPHELLTKKTVSLRQTGDYDFLYHGPKVTITIDRSKYDVLDNSPVRANIEDLYVYEYKNGGPDDKSKKGLIAGVVVAVIVVIVIVIVVVIVVIKKRKATNSEHSSQEGNEIG